MSSPRKRGPVLKDTRALGEAPGDDVLAVRPWHSLAPEVALEALGAGSRGLSSAEAARRLADFGPNRLAATGEAPVWHVLVRQFRSPLIYILLVAAALALILGKHLDAAVVLGLVCVNALLGFFQEHRAQQALSALRRMTSPRAVVLREGEALEVDAAEVVPGDILALSAGDQVAADARLVRAVDLELDESVLTGESVPVDKTDHAIAETELPLGERRSMVFAQTVVTRGHGRAVVVATGMTTEFGRIAADVARAEPPVPLVDRLRQFSRMIAIAVLIAACGLFAVGLARGIAPPELGMFAISAAVSAVPEGLPIVLTVLLAIGVWRMARRKALIRHLPSVEALGAVTVICTDKTGTLTRNEMTVRAMALPGRRFEVSGEGFSPAGAIEGVGGASPERDAGLERLIETCRLCNDAEVVESGGRWSVRGDPTEGALIVLADKAGIDPDWERLAEITFTSERRWMATLNQDPGGGAWVLAKGALERILDMSRHWMSPEGEIRPLDAAVRAEIEAAAEDLAGRSMRLLGFACRSPKQDPVELTPDCLSGRLVFLGVAGLLDPPRPESAESVRICREAGIRVVMVTGDHVGTARAIALSAGILDGIEQPGSVVVGSALDSMTDAELEARCEGIRVYARSDPEHKLRIVRALQARGHIVAMTGDGVNDAPALSQADVGVAMGLSGTEVAKGAADMVIGDDNFASLRAAVEEGRLIIGNLRKVMTYLLTTSSGELATIGLALAMGLPLPLVAVQILWINLITDGTFDKALAVEGPEASLMRVPPRAPRTPLVDREMLWNCGFAAPIMAIGALSVFWLELESGRSLDHARTMTFCTLVLFQWFAVFTFRSLTLPLWRLSWNPWMLLSLAASVVLQLGVIYAEGLQALFHTVPLTTRDLAIAALVASSILILNEARKVVGLIMAGKGKRWRQ
ncbi:MAG: HAD-IC family P-type ATPase [Candidatus Sericytochromatia bacterium]|nr:HAD-IC family P-type ATPase [Candidatus Tanganyikabacteria bacterium]